MPRMGEEKGAVRFRTDHTKFELQSIRYLQPARKYRHIETILVEGYRMAEVKHMRLLNISYQ